MIKRKLKVRCHFPKMCKIAKASLAVLLIALMLKAATPQTFQYSRGWTNGKRSYDSPFALPESTLLDLPARNFDLRTAEALSVLCCDFNCASKRVVKMLRSMDKAQLYLVPCEILRARHRTVNQEKLLDIPTGDERFHHSLSTEYDNTNDNY